MYENIQSFSPDDDYNEVIKVPSNVNLVTKETEIVAEDDQIFLVKLRTQLNQQAPTNSGTVSPPWSMITFRLVCSAKHDDTIQTCDYLVYRQG